MTIAKARKRFHALAIKEALQTATDEERKKLDRYQAVLRPKQTAEEIRGQLRREWEVRRLLKEFGRISHLHQIK